MLFSRLKMRPRSKFIIGIRMIMLAACFVLVASLMYITRDTGVDEPNMIHHRRLHDLSIVNAIDGPRCGAESHLKQAGLPIWIAVIVYLFVGLAIVCDDYFVPSLEVVAERWHLTEDVAGATLMAGGTSSTQLFAALIGVFFFPDDDSGPGTIVGSVVFNICVIIGATMIVTDVKYGKIAIDWYPLTRDSTFNIICLWALFAVENSPEPGEVQWWGGLLLLVIYAVYVVVLAFHQEIVDYLDYKDWWHPFWYTDYEKELISNKEDADEATASEKAVDQDITDLNGRNSVSMIRNPSMGSSGGKKNSQLHQAVGEDFPQKKRQSSIRFAPTPISYRESQTSITRRDTDTSQLSTLRVKTPNYKQHKTTMGSQGTRRTHTTMMSGISKSLVDWEETSKPTTCCGYIGAALLWPWQFMFRWTIPNVRHDKWAEWYWPAFGICIIWLAIITFFVVDMAAKIGACLGLSSNVTGLTILAIGASLPDGLSSMIAARDNKCQMAVCNAFGSNLFDILIGLGFPWLLSGIVHKDSVSVSVHSPLQFILATAVQIIFTIMLLARKLTVDRYQGGILLTLYLAFVVYVVVQNDG